ncbi:hypothetical protein AAHC03_0110 [Spirometra sp. Aus1]
MLICFLFQSAASTNMKNHCPYVQLQNGFQVPLVGFGTSQALDDVAEEAVSCALDTGYRLIDTAAFYDNEAAIGRALHQKCLTTNLRREDVFVTTKLWNSDHGVKHVRPACEKSLHNLGLTYLDLYLIHWPVAYAYEGGEFEKDLTKPQSVDTTSLEDTWREMEKLVDAGLVRSIGLSNFNRSQIQRILKICRIRPQVLQVEVSLFFRNRDLVAFAKSAGMQVTSYATFGSPGMMSVNGQMACPLEEPCVKEIATKRDKTPAQILLRHMLQLGVCTIPKSVTPARIVENFQVFDFELTAAEMEILDKADRNQRVFKAVQ